MASPDLIRRALIEIFSRLDRSAKKPARAAEPPRVDIVEQMELDRTRQQALEAPANADILSQDVPFTRTGTDPQVGPGPTQTNFGDDVIDIMGMDREAVEAADLVRPNQLTSERRALVKSNLREDGTPKDTADLISSKKVLKREQINEAHDSGPPNVFGEEDIGTAATREAITEERGSSNIHSQRRVKPGQETMDSRRSQEQMDNLFGEEEAKEVERIQNLLDEDPLLRTLSDTRQREFAAETIVPDSIRAKEVDQLAKRAFVEYDKIEARLLIDTSGLSQAEFGQLNKARRRLAAFKKELAQVTAKARETNNPQLLEDMLDRLSAPLKNKPVRTESLERTIKFASDPFERGVN